MSKAEAIKKAKQRARARQESQVVFLDFRDEQTIEHFDVIGYNAYLITDQVPEHSVCLIVEHVPGQGYFYEK